MRHLRTLALLLVAAGLMLAGVASAAPAKKIPIWYRGHLVTANLLHGAEPGQPGFVPLPPNQAKSSNDILYEVLNDPNQQVTPEVIQYAPGDPQFTGGRWKIVNAVFNDTLAPADRPNVTSVDQILALAEAGVVDLVETNIYFECTIVSASFAG